MRRTFIRAFAAIFLLVSASACCFSFGGRWDDSAIDQKEMSEDEESDRPLGAESEDDE